MAEKDISVMKYVVRLSGEEREQLEALIRKGKSAAQRLLKARILLKADVSEAGEGWSDNRIIKALETSASMVYRVRKQLVEEGFEAVLSCKQRATPAVARIFDGEKEAKLIALACSKPPKGRARWTLRLLEPACKLRPSDFTQDGHGIDVGGQLEPALAAETLARPRRGAVAMCLCAGRAMTIPHGCSSLCAVRLKRFFLGAAYKYRPPRACTKPTRIAEN